MSPSPAQLIDLLKIRHGRGPGYPLAEAEALRARLFANDNRAMAFVVSIDIRRSTTLMLHHEDMNHYAATLADLICTVESICHTHGGWFDKFTGDGGLFFWTKDLSLGARQHPEAESEHYRVLGEVLQFCESAVCFFDSDIKPRFLEGAGVVPSGYGLAIGVDYGESILTDLPRVMIDGAVSARAAANVTVLGRPVVGATRMCSAAGAGEILLGQIIGRALERQAAAFAHYRLDWCPVETKELKGETQQACRIVRID